MGPFQENAFQTACVNIYALLKTYRRAAVQHDAPAEEITGA
jgi:hypothetical protein